MTDEEREKFIKQMAMVEISMREGTVSSIARLRRP